MVSCAVPVSVGAAEAGEASPKVAAARPAAAIVARVTFLIFVPSAYR
jgi:hypothetical protein